MAKLLQNYSDEYTHKIMASQRKRATAMKRHLVICNLTNYNHKPDHKAFIKRTQTYKLRFFIVYMDL